MAWTQQNFNEYMQFVRQSNWHYEWFRRSRLHTVTEMLKPKLFRNTTENGIRVQKEWKKLPADVQRKYASAWQYVEQNLFPGGARQGRIGQMAAGVAFRRQLRVQSRDLVVNESILQWMTEPAGAPTRFDWKAWFRLRIIRGVRQKQGQIIHVSVPVAAFSGTGREHNMGQQTGLTGAVPANRVGVNLTDRVRRTWSFRIEERWGGGEFVIKGLNGEDLETFNIKFELDYVGNVNRAGNVIYAVQTTDIHHAPEDGTFDMMYWGVDDGMRYSAIAHEFGHLIGNPDEYHTVWFKGYQVTNNRGIMDNAHGRPKAGHFYLVGWHAAEALGAPKNRCYVRLNGHEYRVSNNHPWL